MPPTVTEPFQRLATEYYDCGHLHGFFLGLADEAAFQNPDDYVRLHARLAEMLHARVADTFLTYVSQLFALIFTTCPGSLCFRYDKEPEPTIELSSVIEHESIDELLAYVANDRVHRISYQGLRKMNTLVQNQLDFELFPSSEDLSRAVLIVEARNLIAHNYAIVNDVYLRRTHDSTKSIGDRLIINTSSITGDATFLNKIARDIDARAIAKWHLPSIDVLPPSLDQADDHDGHVPK